MSTSPTTSAPSRRTWFAGTGDEALPPTRSQEKRWTRAIRARLTEWVRDQARPIVEDGLAGAGFAAGVRVDGGRLYIGYEPLFEETGLVRPEIMLEFGARSTGEPHEIRPVVCDAAAHLPDLAFPAASPAVLSAERTFWEKATAIHVFCRQERRRGERFVPALARSRTSRRGRRCRARIRRPLARTLGRPPQGDVLLRERRDRHVDRLRSSSVRRPAAGARWCRTCGACR